MISVPTSGMAVAFVVGLALALIWGMQVAVSGANTFSEFFGALATIFPLSSAVTWVILVILVMAIFYLARILFPFFLGIVVGLLILSLLSSTLFQGITEDNTGSVLLVTGYIKSWGRSDSHSHGLSPGTSPKWSVVN